MIVAWLPPELTGPKPWYGRWQSFEDHSVSSGYNLIYFAGNTLFYAAVLLLGWLAWRLAMDRTAGIRSSERGSVSGFR